MPVRTRVWSRWELDPRLPEAATELRMTEFPAAGEESEWSVLLLPGGAYRMTAPREGAPVAAAVAAAGLGILSDLDCVRSFIPAAASYFPSAEKHRLYEPYYQTFRKLHSANRKMYKGLRK